MTRLDLGANATTPLLPAVREAMRPFALDLGGNPAGAHTEALLTTTFGDRAERRGTP